MAGFMCCVWWLLFGVLLGWLLNWLFDKFFRRGGGGDHGRGSYSVSTPLAPMPPPRPRPAPSVSAAPVVTAASLASAAAGFGFSKLKSANGYDNFEVIEGIGPKINEVMHNAGVHTFAALGAMDIPSIAKILDAAGSNFKLANPETWAQQAALCASGHWEKLKAWQDELVAGVSIQKDNA
jgi:predicted flap endonuclease-1-like 5' DNA nuclease